MPAITFNAFDNRAQTPLVAIEREVQERAKQANLDVNRAEGQARMAALVEEQVDRWHDEFLRGMRPYDLIDRDIVVDRALRNLLGYGPITPLLEDDNVWEIMINAPYAIFVKRHDGRSGFHDEVFHDDEHVIRTITKILDDASGAHRKLDPAEGLQDAQLTNGARMHIVHGDLSRGGHLIVNIRKFTGVPIRTLDELIHRGSLDRATADFLTACVRSRLSVLFAGAPGSGKTTLMSCCTAALDPALRVVVAEEVFEADLPLVNVAQMQTRAPRADRPAVDLRRLVAGFLRMAPDVAIVGEVRDREALPLLLTLSSGVTGYTTIHAGSARQALTRLRFICQLSDVASDLPIAALNTLVAESVDIVVHCMRDHRGVFVNEIVSVEDLAGGAEATQFTVTELFRRGSDRQLHWTGNLPVRAARSLANYGYEVSATLRNGR